MNKPKNEIIECSLGITPPLEIIPCASCQVVNYLPAERDPDVGELCANCNKSLHINAWSRGDKRDLKLWEAQYAQSPFPEKAEDEGLTHIAELHNISREWDESDDHLRARILASRSDKTRLIGFACRCDSAPREHNDENKHMTSESNIRKLDKFELGEVSIVKHPTDPTVAFIKKAPSLIPDKTIEVTELVNGSWKTSIEVVNWKEKL